VLVLKNAVAGGLSALQPDVVEDVREECQMHGKVIDVRAIFYSRTDNVDLVVLYEQARCAEMARAALDGRFFAGKQLHAVVRHRRHFAEARPIDFATR
jgi:hypothetical protein